MEELLPRSLVEQIESCASNGFLFGATRPDAGQMLVGLQEESLLRPLLSQAIFLLLLKAKRQASSSSTACIDKGLDSRIKAMLQRIYFSVKSVWSRVSKEMHSVKSVWSRVSKEMHSTFEDNFYLAHVAKREG